MGLRRGRRGIAKFAGRDREEAEGLFLLLCVTKGKRMLPRVVSGFVDVVSLWPAPASVGRCRLLPNGGVEGLPAGRGLVTVAAGCPMK